ncbi:hypothetical protein [Archangium sp.]|uniref:hypothetical protein n=1 Tax=Archangium sp. TaxID=1872627 RepID=UPI002D69E80F|nr:hypothetical protein [Archangium sp.]HYO51405.1 hypothetical protein [Archangium sp.]
MPSIHEALPPEVVGLVGATLALPVFFYLLISRRRGWPPLSALPVLIASALAIGAGVFRLAPEYREPYVRALEWVLIPAELLGLGYALVVAVRVVRALRRSERAGDFHERLRQGMREEFGKNRLADIFAMELSVLYYGLFSWMATPRTGPEGGAHPYHRESGYALVFPVLMVALVLETLLVHLLSRRVSELAAWVLTALSVYSLLWFVADRRAMALRPHLLDGEALRLRLGLRWDAVIPLTEIASIRRASPPPAPRTPGYWRAVPFGAPQLLLELRAPLTVLGPYGLRKQGLHTVGVAVDDPEALERALSERLGQTLEAAAPRFLGDFYDRLCEGLGSTVPNPSLADAMAHELGLLAYALFFWKLKPAPLGPEQRAFTTHRKSGYGAVLTTLMTVGLLEMVLVHALLSRWSPGAAWVLTVLSLYGLLWLFGDYQALGLRPMLVDGGTLHLRIGLRRGATIPLSNIRALTHPTFGLPRRAPNYLRATVMGSPKLLLELREPVRAKMFPVGEQAVSRIGLTVDDEAAFEWLVQAHLQPEAAGPSSSRATGTDLVPGVSPETRIRSPSPTP